MSHNFMQKTRSSISQYSGILFLTTILFILRLIASWHLELGIDEAYYWFYSLNIKLNYFDHPPLLAWSIFLTTAGQHFSSEFFIRLPAVVSWTVASVLIYQSVKVRCSRNAALGFLSLFSLSFYTSIVAGTLIIPDAPLMLWTGLLLYFIIKWDQHRQDHHLILIFITAGLCNWSKYQSLIFVPILLLWFLRFSKDIYKQKALYVGLGIYSIVLFPLLYFNLLKNTDQVSYHGSRFSMQDIDIINLFKTIFTEFIFQNPMVFIFIIIAILRKSKWTPLQHLMIWMATPILVLGWGLSLFESVLPHWTGPAYFFLITFCAITLDWKKHFSKMKFALLIQCALIIMAMAEINQGWFSNKIAHAENVYFQGRADGTLDMFGWHQLEKKLKSEYQINPMVINHWYPGSHLHYYVAQPLGIEIIPHGDSKSLHEYIYHRNANQHIPEGSYFIESSRFPRRQMGDLILDFEFEEVGRIPITRRQDTVMTYFVHRMWRCEGD